MAALSATEMVYETKLIYEGIASGIAPGYTSREWSVLLTQAQENLVYEIMSEGIQKDMFNIQALQTLVRKFESNLISQSTVWYRNSYVLMNEIPQEVLYNLNERIVIQITGQDPIYVDLKSISYDYYAANINNPYKKPDRSNYFWKIYMPISDIDAPENPIYGNGIANPPYSRNFLVISDGISLALSGGTNHVYRLDFLRKPQPIIVKSTSYSQVPGVTIEGFDLSDYRTSDLNCELDHSIHRKICAKAAKLAYASLQEQAGYQIQSIEEKNLDSK